MAARRVRDPGRPRRPRKLARRESVATRDGDRGLRWIVSAYVLGLVGGGLVALVGLAEGWW